MGTTTTTFALNKPTVGGDDNAWGTDLNANADKLDDLLDGTTGITPNLLTGWEVGGVAVTATAAELNILDGVTASAAELNILDGVTASTTELNYVDGVTSAIQTQIDAKYDSGDLASQAEAEAGTDNTKVMTPLRAAQAIAALAPAPTTASVLSALAGASAGAVGTYMFGRTTGADAARGATIAGSSLVSTSAVSFNLAETNTAGITESSTEASLSGTWRCMGTMDYAFIRTSGPTAGGSTLWLRIS